MKIKKRFTEFQVSSFKFPGRPGERTEGLNAAGIVGGVPESGPACCAANFKLETSSSRESGIALIITLILLSVITFMAVTFLVISRHAANQVATTTQQVIAQQAAQTALDQAEARIMAQMIAQNNGFNFGPVVSTNFQSPYFDTTQPAGTIGVTNINYYDINGAPLTGNSYLQMLNNQLVLPRPPVFVVTNKAFAPEFRYYQDLNRNGMFDSNGVVPMVDQFGNTNFSPVVGDPEWIGVLQHPDQPHSRSNFYIFRYAFFAQPIGNSEDVNYINNQAKQLATNGDGFYRDQGVGSWDINLAGFLYALNPNVIPNVGWVYGGYDSRTPFGGGGYFASPGTAFEDAASITAFRYNGSYNNLKPFLATGLFANNANQIDYFSIGAPQLPANNVWSGSDDLNRLFTLQDWFIQPMGNFPANLYNAGRGAGAFNEYTFYRMLSQLGTESSPEPTNKLNLNYDNLDPAPVNGAISRPSATNSLTWNQSDLFQPGLKFFTNAANKLLGAHTNFVVNVNGLITNLSPSFIPIYPTNYYTPSVHRMLQLAANIYDATTNKTSTPPFDFDYPSVFRPTFGTTNIFGQPIIYISGYVEVGADQSPAAAYNAPVYALPDDLTAVETAITGLSTNLNIYGAPWVIGAKRGFPNFNQVSMQSYSEISRKLQIVKSASNPINRALWHTNVQYVIGVSNQIVVEAWNSYSSNYTRPTTIGCVDTVSMYLTNEGGVISNFTTSVGTGQLNTGLFITNWAPYPTGSAQANQSQVTASFKQPVYTTIPFMPDSIYHPATLTMTPVSGTSITPFDTTTGYPLPQFGLNITNRLRFVMVDTNSGRVIDYVQLNGMNNQRQLTSELMGNPTSSDYGGHGGVWDSNRVGGTFTLGDPLLGIQYQIQASQQNPPYLNPAFILPITAQDWANMLYPPQGNFSSVSAAVQSFNDFYNNNTNRNPALSNQVPYTPTRQVSTYFTWQANDPLVHYTLPDLTGLGDLAIAAQTNYVFTNQILGGIQQVNKRYRPWGPTVVSPTNDAYTYNMALKDPMITRSDDWNFPTNKFPNIGWLGRVHRGTPWQTVYMKSSPVNHTNWINWTGNAEEAPGNPFVSDASTTEPINDWSIFDLFTTAPNDNATRGQLSVNQTNFAAWAAVFDGVTVETNPAGGAVEPLVIDPNTNASALLNLVSSINMVRSTAPGGVFTQLGEVLAVPQLSVNSPFLNPSNSTPNDEQYERLPQQIMSLLRVGSPRYVIYAYGQSLKPADNSLQIGGAYYGTCTNYQVTGEMETRTVISFEPTKPAPLISTNPAVTYANRISSILNPTQNPIMLTNAPLNQLPVSPPQPRAVIQNFNILPPE